MAMLTDFKKFILRGNVVDLAVAVIIGTSFTGVITALTKDFIYPLISSLYSQKQSTASYFIFNHQKFMYGNFINAVLSFLIVSFVVFFFVVQPINKLLTISARKQVPVEPNTKKCPKCISDIPKAAVRCPFCTSNI